MPEDKVAARGRPRSPDADRAIVAATLAVLAESGYSGLTVDAVARRAGVGRPTVYRRWPGKDELVVHALVAAVPPLRAGRTGDALEDLKELALDFATRLAASPVGRTVLAVHAEAGSRPDLAALLRDHYLRPRDTLIRQVIADGVGAGRLRADLDPATIRDLLFGPPIYHWLITGGLPDAAALRAMVEAAGHAVAAGPE